MVDSGFYHPWTFAEYKGVSFRVCPLRIHLNENMIDEIVEKIINKPLFLKLKEVVEENGYHDHESVYDHLVKTKNIARREILANFITNPKAKKLFLNFVNEDFHGYKRSDLMILIALLHDVGKVLVFKEDSKISSLIVTDSNGKTRCPGHEYWGSTIVKEFVKDLSLPNEVISYISKLVGLHGAFQADYLPSRKNLPLLELINDIKSGAEGYYIESMFNNFCDVYTAIPFQPLKQLVIDIFNGPYFYTKREYVIPKV